MPYILALDQGTTSSRAMVFDRDGRIVSMAQREFRQIYPKPGWVEHDPDEIWRSQISVAIEALANANLQPADIAAIGITNQRETTLLWDRETGEPLHNAIVWQDRRTAPLCESLRNSGHEPEITARTGLVLDPYFSGTKVHWLLENVSGARARADAGKLAFGTVDSWLLYKLTAGAVHATDASNASRTLLYNIQTGEWDTELCRLLDVPMSLLPAVRDSSGVFGAARVDGLSGIPIAGIAGDQQAALFGQACLSAGMTKNTYGTGCFMLHHTSDRAIHSSNKLLTTVAAQLSGKVTYALEGAVFVGGAVVQWLRDGLGIIRSAPEVEALANSVPDNGGVYLVPAFTGLGAPHWDPHARGAIFGITRGATAAHIARAALESIALQVADLLDAMKADSGLELPELRVDGGASVNNTLMQLQADLLGIPVVRPATTETTALGAAYLAGLAVHYWQGQEDVTEQWRADRRFEPVMSVDRATALKTQWHRAIERSKNWSDQ